MRSATIVVIPGIKPLRPRPALAAVLLLAAVVCWVLWPAVTVSASEIRRTCLSGGGDAAIDACTRVLQKNDRDEAAHLALADALMQQHRYRQAVDRLRAGLKALPGSHALAQKMAAAGELFEEQRWIEKRRRQQSGKHGSTSQVAARRFEIRCTGLKGQQALEACVKGLARFPNNRAMQVGRADALMDMGRYGQAMDAYQVVVDAGFADDRVRRQLKLALARRKPSPPVVRSEKKPEILPTKPPAISVREEKPAPPSAAVMPAPNPVAAEPAPASAPVPDADHLNPPEGAAAMPDSLSKSTRRYDNAPVRPGQTH